MKLTNPSTKEAATTAINVVSRFSNNRNVNMYYFDGSSYLIKVYGANGKVVGKNQLVVIKIGKKSFKVRTNAQGYAILKIPQQITPGTHIITATYAGQTVKNILKVKQPLASKKVVAIKKSSKKLILRAILKNGKTPLKGKLIAFKLNGKTKCARTNSKGIAQIVLNQNIIKNLRVGRNLLQITYLKDTIKTITYVKK